MPGNYPFIGNAQTFTNDFAVNSQDPGVMYGGTETNALYFEDREVAGTIYRAQNATFNKVSQSWIPIDSTKPAYALSFANGVLTQLFASAGTSPITAWTQQASWSSGTGVPSFTATAGSLFSRTDGTTGARLYVSAGGGTWNAVAGV